MNKSNPKKNKKGLKLTLVGILIGLIAGFAILGLESYVATQLRNLLNEEAQKACDCSFDASNISISLLTMRGTATDARILRNGEPRLIFKTANARFSLARASEKLLVLSDLHLQDGVAYNVDEDSVTFQFIDSLSTPPPPERQKEERWKLHLDQLRVSGARFTQDFPGTYIRGSAISLLMNRNSNNDFELKPTIGDLKLTLKQTNRRPYEKTIELGKVTSRLTLEDSQALFRKLQLVVGKSIVLIDATSHTHEDNRLVGGADMVLESSLLQLSDFIQTEISGQAALSGSLGNPGMNGNFTLKDNSLTPFYVEGIPVFLIDSLAGKFTYDLKHGQHLLTVPQLSARGPGTEAKITRGLILDDDSIDAGFSVSVDEFRYEGITIFGANASITLSNTLDDITFVVEGTSDRTAIGDFFLPPLRFRVGNKPELSFAIKHNSTHGGAFDLTGAVDTTSGRPILKNGIVKLDNLALIQELDPEEQNNPDTLKKVRLSGTTRVSGPLTLYDIAGDGTITLASRHFAGEAALTGTVAIKEGSLQTQVFNKSESLRAALDINFQNSTGKAELTLSDFKPTEYYPDARCFEIAATALYEFGFQDINTGEGAIQLNKLLLGCNPYSVALQKPTAIPIHKGQAILNDLVLSSAATDFLLSGTATPEALDIKASGSLFLNTFLGFIPALDDLSGSIEASLSITGKPAAPVIDGSAKIVDGEFSSEASDFIASNLQGTVRLTNGQISIEYLTGTVNNGTIAVHGEGTLRNLEDASMTLDISQMVINSVPDVALTVSSSLTVSPGELAPLIEGSIFIDSLEARKQINLSSIVKAIVRDPAHKATLQSMKNLPAADLSVTISAPRNIFLYSNFLNAEFAADLQLTGTLNAPIVQGSLNSQTGWLGLKNRRFEITSGVITFSDDPSNPSLEIIGETSVFGKTGEFVTIIMEASGTLAAPEIELSSDTGLTQSEILNLLTSSIRDLERTRANALGDSEIDSSVSLIDQRPGNVLRNVLHKLTTLDDIAVEPALNNRTGAIEPALTATKNLTDDIAIIGDTFVGTEPSSRLRVRYDLTPYLNISALVDSINTAQNSSLGVDLTYTVFARKVPFTTYKFDGNERFDAIDILRGIKLNGDSRIRPDELPELTRRFEKFYYEKGYLHALAVLHCETTETFCRSLRVKIFEGPEAHVVKREIVGDTLPPEIPENRLPSLRPSLPATEEIRAYQQQSLIELLRSEGYLTARARASYRETTTHDVVLAIDLTVGAQDSFFFEGNTIFSPEDFLETINLFNRKQPFGRNTIHILVENIERMYREAGYLFASIDFSKNFDPVSKKTTYHIQIQEEVPVRVAETRLSGNEAITTKQLKDIFRERLPEDYLPVFESKTLVAERMDASSQLLKSLYNVEGYPSATVNYIVFPGASDEELILEYVISEGSPLIFRDISVVNFPADATLPTTPDSVLSVPRINLYIASLVNALKDNGYQQSTIQSVYDEDTVSIEVNAGPQTTVGKIQLEGLAQVPEHLVRDNIFFSTGNPLRKELLQKSRRTLLLIGLFSRVEIIPSKTKDPTGSQDILIRLVERSLTTLEVGAGLNSELGVHTFGEAIDKSIFLDGSSLGFRLDLFVDEQDGGVNQGVAGMRYTKPRFLQSDFQLTQDARFQKTDLTTLEYDLERYILDSALYRRFGRSGTINLSYSLLQDNVSSVSDGAQLSALDEGIVNLSLLGASIRWDERDSPVLPSEGFAMSLEPRVTSRGIGSDANFYSIGARAGYLHPIFSTPFSIAEHMRVASAWTFNGTREMPITQRYYLGGRQSIRGFRENSLGPRGTDGSIIGGDVLLQNNFEFRYRMQETLSTHLFFDSGNVFLRSQSVDLDDLRTSIGIGARYLSPIGPIGFDLGHPLDEREGEPSVRFHFSIGATF